MIQLEKLKDLKVLVVGDLMLDRFWSGAAKRLASEAPLPVLSIGEVDDRLGAAGNVAANLTGLGCQVTVMGMLSDDEPGSVIQKLCRQKGIEIEPIIVHEPTILKIRLMQEGYQLARADFEKRFSEEHQQVLLERMKAIISSFDVFVLADCCKGTIQHSQAMIALAKQHHIPVFVDSKKTNWDGFSGVELMKLNHNEWLGVTGLTDMDKAESLVFEYMNRYNIQNILITKAQNGMTLYQRDGGVFHSLPYGQMVCDVIGAGDTVMALIVGLYNQIEISWPKRLDLASYAAGFVIRSPKTTSIHWRDLQNHTCSTRDRIMNEGALIEYVQTLQAQKMSVVVTDGCFDLMHQGHVRFLAEAKELGQYLIVLAHNDAMVRQLKGNHRPINDEQARAEVLSACSSVDAVMILRGDIQQVVERIKPDVLVKSRDCDVDYSAGQVKKLEFMPNISSDSIIKRCQSVDLPDQEAQ